MPETWQLSEIKMIQFPKKAKSHDFGRYLQAMFPHIPAQSFFSCRIAIMRNFSRSDLCLKKWQQISTSGAGNQWLGMSSLELTRDGIMLIVKDNSRHVREDLTHKEISDYTNQ